MKRISSLAVTVTLASLIFLLTPQQASAEVNINGRFGLSMTNTVQTVTTQKTVIIVKDASGQETVIIEEKPTVVNNHYYGNRDRFRHHGPPRNRPGHHGPGHRQSPSHHGRR
jgi:hypothetical protein